MSYTISVKNELAELMPEKRCCKLSELSGMINTAGMLKENVLSFKTENWTVAKKYFTLLQKAFNIDAEGSYVKKTRASKNSAYELKISSLSQVDKVIAATGVAEGSEFTRHISGIVTKNECCKRSYLRGTFLAGGSITSPEKEYHLEISLKSESNAEKLVRLMKYFEIHMKPLSRAQGFSVYAKDSAAIADILNAAGAKNALFSYENSKVIKEIRNGVNRLVNCDTANINKTVGAAQKQIKAIRFIEDTAGLSYLGSALRHTAQARLDYPELKLEELGAVLGIGKSGVNHRLRKIEAIAEELRDYP